MNKLQRRPQNWIERNFSWLLPALVLVLLIVCVKAYFPIVETPQPPRIQPPEYIETGSTIQSDAPATKPTENEGEEP